MLAFAKVSVLPASLIPNTFYFIAESDNEKFSCAITDETGAAIRRTMSKSDVTAMLETFAETVIQKKDLPAATGTMNTPVGVTPTGALMAQDQPVRKLIYLYDLPNVGDIAEIQLGGRLAFTFTKTINSGNEAYRAELYSLGGDVMICYRRDSTYDSSSTEGSNQNNFLLTSGTRHVVDGTVYGSMRDRGIIAIVHQETGVTWDIMYYGYGVGKLRIVTESMVDDPSTPGAATDVIFAGTYQPVPVQGSGPV